MNERIPTIDNEGNVFPGHGCGFFLQCIQAGSCIDAELIEKGILDPSKSQCDRPEVLRLKKPPQRPKPNS